MNDYDALERVFQPPAKPLDVLARQAIEGGRKVTPDGGNMPQRDGDRDG